MEKNNDKITKRLYIIGGIIFVIVIIFSLISSYINKSNEASPTSDESITIDEETGKVVNQNIVGTLQNMKERDRMEYYFGEFLHYIEDEEYEEAYDLLNEDFKKNYFPKLDDFKSYIPTVFSEMTNIKHENIERNGNVYVLWLKITDALNGKPGEEKEMNIVIKENDYNDFEMSFSVI